MRAPSPAQHNDPNPLFLIVGGLAAPFPATGWLALLHPCDRSIAFVSAMYYSGQARCF
jgi:hypothetical protein